MAFRQTGYVIAAAALALALDACAPQAPPAPAAAAPVAPVSYDGTYVGTIVVSGTGAGVPIGGCDTKPGITLQVQNNSFTYHQTHPNAATNAPSFGDVTYTVAIAPDGSFNGPSQYSGSMRGRILGGHMTGIVDGLVCVYSFNADKQ